MNHPSCTVIALASLFSVFALHDVFAGHTPPTDPALDQIQAAFKDAAAQLGAVTGVVAGIDGQTLILTVGSGRDARNIPFTANRHTRVCLNGKACALGQLRTGQRAAVVCPDGPPTRIEATSGN